MQLRRLKHRVFSCEVYKIFKNTFLYKTPLAAVSVFDFYYVRRSSLSSRTKKIVADDEKNMATVIKYTQLIHQKKITDVTKQIVKSRRGGRVKSSPPEVFLVKAVLKIL